MSHRKLGHSSGGELQFAGWFDGATLAPLGSVELALCPLGGAVAVADVLGERVAEGVPDQVADPLPAVEGCAVPPGPAARRPAAAVPGAETLRAFLVEADHDAVPRLLAVQSEDPRCLGRVVGIGALLPASRALQRDSVASEDPAQ